MLKKYLPAVIFIFLFQQSIFSQWNAGLSLNVKKDKPYMGIGFIVGHNLPFQWPVLGFKLRLEGDFFRGTDNGALLTHREINFYLQSFFYFKIIQPYLSIGTGFGYLDAPTVTSYSALLSAFAGVQFTFIKPFYPFLELRTTHYFSKLDKGPTDEKTDQLFASLGVIFEF